MTSALLLAALLQVAQATPPPNGGKVTCTVGRDGKGKCRGTDATTNWLADLVNKEVEKPGSGISEAFGEEEGRAVLSCVAVGDGRVRDCTVAEERPTGGNAGEEALRQAPDLRIAATVPAGKKVRVPVIFRERLVAASDVVYVRRPDARMFASLYPEAARRKRVEGEASVKCRVAESGMLGSCRVVHQTPEGAGFGAAALALTSAVQVAPKTRSGEPTADAKLVLPFTFQLGR